MYKCGPSSLRRSVFLINLISNNINAFKNFYVYSPSLHQDLYRKLIKSFNKYTPIHIIPNILNEENFDRVIPEIVNGKNLETIEIETEVETIESKEELNFPQDYHDDAIIVLDDLNEKEMNDRGVQAMV